MTLWRRSLALWLLLGVPLLPLGAWRIQYVEQFYKLYHQHLHRYPEDSAENIWYLSMALRSPFANPLNALAKIEDETEWEKYRHLFRMHLHLEIVEQYLVMASKYDKAKAYFYNYPWKAANLDSLQTAKAYYELALEQWHEALKYQVLANDPQFRWIYLEEVRYWEEEVFRIETEDLDYQEIIQGHLDRLAEVQERFETMEPY